ncbi:unnamed protein product [Closterium sp. Naga37s-1]|nr:unnamed protein product [Closterium sp. Naga37s-1]
MANASKFLMAAGAAVGRSGAVPALLSRVFHAAVASRSLAPIAIATANIATSASVSAPTSGPTGCISTTTEPFQTMPYPSWESSHSSHSSHGSRRTQSGDGSSDSGLEHRALLVDAAGTLVEPSEPVTKVYASLGRKYGVKYSEDEILQRYRHAYIQPWRKSILRYEDDARPFWQYVVSESTGCNHPDYLEELYQYYTTKEAWRLTDPHAKEAFTAIRDAGVKIAVVSNFDTRLRTVLKELDCHDWFDAIAVSAEIQAEKPNPVIFHSACDLVGVDPHHAVHVGDDRRNDLWGARDAGCSAWLWQDDVHSFHDVARKLGVLFPGEEESPEANKRRIPRPPRWADRPMIAANGLQFMRH